MSHFWEGFRAALTRLGGGPVAKASPPGVSRSREGALVQERQRHGERGASFLLKRSEDPEEGNDKNTEGLSHSENKSLQGDHPLPRSLVHSRDGGAFKQSKTRETIGGCCNVTTVKNKGIAVKERLLLVRTPPHSGPTMPIRKMAMGMNRAILC